MGKMGALLIAFSAGLAFFLGALIVAFFKDKKILNFFMLSPPNIQNQKIA